MRPPAIFHSYFLTKIVSLIRGERLRFTTTQLILLFTFLAFRIAFHLPAILPIRRQAVRVRQRLAQRHDAAASAADAPYYADFCYHFSASMH